MGLAVVVCLLSVFFNKQMPKGWAFSGEVTIDGKFLGGLAGIKYQGMVADQVAASLEAGITTLVVDAALAPRYEKAVKEQQQQQRGRRKKGSKLEVVGVEGVRGLCERMKGWEDWEPTPEEAAGAAGGGKKAAAKGSGKKK